MTATMLLLLTLVLAAIDCAHILRHGSLVRRQPLTRRSRLVPSCILEAKPHLRQWPAAVLAAEHYLLDKASRHCQRAELGVADPDELIPKAKKFKHYQSFHTVLTTPQLSLHFQITPPELPSYPDLYGDAQVLVARPDGTVLVDHAIHTQLDVDNLRIATNIVDFLGRLKQTLNLSVSELDVAMREGGVEIDPFTVYIQMQQGPGHTGTKYSGAIFRKGILELLML